MTEAGRVSVTTHLLQPRKNPHPAKITERRKQVLYWMARGKTNPEIGAILGLSWCTVKNHVEDIMRIYGTPNRICAVMRALARGDVPFEEIAREFA